MKTYKFDSLLQKEGWLHEIYIKVNEENIIESISQDKPEEGEVFPKEGLLFPGFLNAHSHAFQYAMCGQNENLPSEAKRDDFWSWRENMYKLALTLGPEEMEKIATKLYCEMSRHGYTNVAEFHYLHHDKDGNPYSNLSEMSERLMNAATSAGLGLTLVPIFYQMGGFNAKANERQRRFLSKDLDDYLFLHESITKAAENYPNVIIGKGIHSLRAVESEQIIEFFKKAHNKSPLHMHISEQESEVRDSVSHLKKRPVEWLLDNVEIDEHCHLVHATHLSEDEIERLSQSKANVVICASTEANLGDGLFPLLEYFKKGGQFSIGTDSHIGISPMEELRWLDYGVRLIEKKRNPLCLNGEDHSGDILYHMTYQNGLKAMGIERENYFSVGEKLSGFLIKSDTPLFENCVPENILDTLIYSAGPEHLERV